ncbi:MAG TPA: hypothetical protein VN861_06110 [Candidatus Acidoferrales bacterium]|nr:hypothetical protein [Candidatus Acidoferrales bacterium]
MTKEILAVSAALLFTTLAHGQSYPRNPVTANVPFAFQAGDTKMPAGEYHIQRAAQGSTTMEEVRAVGSSANALLPVSLENSKGSNDKSKLIFHCYRAECFLAEIRSEGGQTLQIMESRREKNLSQAKSENQLAVVSVPLSAKP